MNRADRELFTIKEDGNTMMPECTRMDGQSDVLLLTYQTLEETGLVTHCFTTREGGVSTDIYESMNLSFTRGDDEDCVMENYRRLAKALGIEMNQFVCSDQTHTTNVRKVTREDAGKGITRPRDYTDVDGLITNEPGLMLSTFYADCVPLYFVDPVHRAIGLSHSGWRGTVNRMGMVTIQAMQREYGTNPADIICAIGPSICQECYEVSTDVAEEFASTFAGHENEILADKKNGKYQLDLWQANKQVMLDAGISKEHITMPNVCTCCNSHILFSHRASHGKRGNLGAFLMLR